MANKKPRVSIGLPVFNGDKYLKAALDSLLSQTYQDFELLISDNASTDCTRQICLEYMNKDNRVRYYRNETNLGASRNFNRVFALSSGEYFKWANYDDIHAPEYLSRCVDVLDNNPTAVLCHSKVGKIDELGEVIGKYNAGTKTDSPKTHERFGGMISLVNDGWILIHGLMRTSSLKKTQLLGSYISADRNLLAEITLIGRMHQVPETLFFRRAHSQAYTNKNHKDISEKLSWWTQANPKKLVFPYWRVCSEYFKSVRYMGLRWPERQLCYAQIGKWFIREGWFFMSLDVVVVLRRLLLPSKLKPFAKYLLQRWFELKKAPVFQD